MKKTYLLPLLGVFLFSLSGCNQDYGKGLTGAVKYAKDRNVGFTCDVYSVNETTGGGVDTLEYKSHHIHNVFNDGILSSDLTYYYELSSVTFEQTYNATYFRKSDGNTYLRALSIQNTVVDNLIKNSSGEAIVFDDNFKTPFNELSYTDFIEYNGSYILKPAKKTTFSTVLTQQRMSVAKAEFEVKNDKFSKITIYTENSASLITGVYTYYRYEINLNWNEKTSVPKIKVHPVLKGQDNLEDALFTLSRALQNKNFTADSKINNGSTTSDSQFYATPEAVYCSSEDSYGKTYGARKSLNSYYDFVVSTKNGEQVITTYDEDPIKESEIYPNYRGFSAQMFEVSEDKLTFTAYEGSESGIISLIAPYTQKSYYANYINHLEIRLNSSKNFSSLYFEYYDVDNNLRGNVELKYQDIGSTELPINL